jgi:hypothetical protein
MTEPRRYRPGHRGYNLKNRSNRISDERIAWVDTARMKFYLMRYFNEDPYADPDLDNDSDVGCNFVLMITKTKGKPISLNLGACTEEELKLIRELLNLSIDLAMPVAIARDRAAKEAHDAGDDSYTRVYRTVPQLVKRPGAFGPDGKSVLNGLEDLPKRVRNGVPPPPGRVPGVGPRVAANESEEAQAEDDSSSAD